MIKENVEKKALCWKLINEYVIIFLNLGMLVVDVSFLKCLLCCDFFYHVK